MSKVTQLLGEYGYKFTTPRRVVGEVLETFGQAHFSVNEVWEAVRRVNNSVGRMTVYRTLDLFARIGYIHPVAASDARNGIVYVVMQDGHHHHIVCQNCHTVIEFDECHLGALVETLQEKYGCAIKGHLLEFYGLCSNCNVSSPA